MEQVKEVQKVVQPKAKAYRTVLTPLGILGLIGCGVLVFLWLQAQIELSSLTTQNSDLRSDYSTASAESARLKLDYENVFNIIEIEREATAKYGMSKATELQTVYIGAESDSKVMILSEGVKDEGLLGKIADILNKLSEYIFK